MTAIKYYINSIKNEFLKIKGSYLLLIVVLCVLFIPAIYFVHYLVDFKRLIPNEGVNPWNRFFLNQVTMTPILISFFVVLITSFIAQIEHRTSGTKHLFALPIPKWSIYFGKQTVLVLCVFASYLLFLAIILMSGYILGFLYPQLNFSVYSPDVLLYSKVLFSSFTTILGILSIQFWISFKVKNFMVPLGIGMVLVIAAIVLFRSQRIAPYYPYAYTIINLNSINFSDTASVSWLSKYSYLSLAYFSVISVIGFLNVSKMNIK